MSKFTKNVHYEMEFEGDKLSMDLQRFKRKEMQKLMPYIETDEEGKIAKMGFKSQADFSSVAISFLPSYVSNFQGLKDEHGKEITIEEVVEEMYFNNIVIDIITKLFEISRLSEEESKNSNAPSDIDTKEPVSETH